MTDLQIVAGVVPEAHFEHPQVKKINVDLFDDKTVRLPATTEVIHELRVSLKRDLHQFIEDFGIQLLVIENALSLPMNVPLGLALTELIAETNIPTIAHHHDFWWERERFTVNAAEDFLQTAFPTGHAKRLSCCDQFLRRNRVGSPDWITLVDGSERDGLRQFAARAERKRGNDSPSAWDR